MTFGAAVFNRRRELGISQKDLAKALHVSAATISKIENDQISSDSDASRAITDFLHLDDPIKETYTTGNTNVDLGMLEKRIMGAIYELELVLDIVRSMKGET